MLVERRGQANQGPLHSLLVSEIAGKGSGRETIGYKIMLPDYNINIKGFTPVKMFSKLKKNKCYLKTANIRMGY